MAITLVASVTAGPGVNGGTTAAITTTGATLLVVSVAWYSGVTTTPTLSDAKGNTWIGLTTRAHTFTNVRLYYCLTPTVGTGHTFTLSGTTIAAAILVYAFAGVGSYQVESGLGGVGGSPAACGSVTPTANGALVVTGRVGNAVATDAVSPAGFTVATVPFVGGVTEQGSAAYAVQATAAAINPTWSWTGGSPSENAVVAAVFLPAVAPSPPQSSTNAQFTAPSAAAGAAITPNATAWANSAYATVLAATSAAAVLTGIVVFPTTGVTAEFELDIATGAASAEVVIATIKGKFFGNTAWDTAYVPLPIPIDNIASGARLSARLRKSGTDVNPWRAAITYLTKPIVGTVQTTAQPLKATAAGGPLPALNTNSADWVNTTWKELITVTPTAIVLTHVIAPAFSGNAQFEFDLGVGSAGSETVVTTVRIQVRSNDGGPWIVPLPNPLDAIPAATRVAARYRGTNTFSSGPFGLLYLEKPL